MKNNTVSELTNLMEKLERELEQAKKDLSEAKRMENEGKQPASDMLSNRDLEVIFNTIKDNFTIDEIGEYEEMWHTHRGYDFDFEKAIFILDPMEKTLTVEIAVNVDNWLEAEPEDLFETKVLSVDIEGNYNLKQPAPLSYEDLEIIFNTIDDNFTIDEVGEYEDIYPIHPRFGDYALSFKETTFYLDLTKKTLTADVLLPYVENWFELETDLSETKVLSVDIS